MAHHMQSPRQKMDANIGDQEALSDADRLRAITRLARGTPGYLVLRNTHNKTQPLYFDAILACNSNSRFSMKVARQIAFQTRQPIYNTPKAGKPEQTWQLSDLKGLSLEEDSTVLIRELYDEAAQNNNTEIMEYITTSALGFAFNGPYNEIFGTVNDDINRDSELSFLLYEPSDLTYWIDGLAHIAQVNDLDMNVAEVEEQFEAIALNTELSQQQQQQQQQSSQSNQRRRLSRQEWTMEGLEEETKKNSSSASSSSVSSSSTASRKTLRRTRFTICPNTDDSNPSNNGTTAVIAKKRQSVFNTALSSSSGSGSTNGTNIGSNDGKMMNQQQQQQLIAEQRAIFEQELKKKEFEFESKLEKIESGFGRESQLLRDRLERANNDSLHLKQLKSEMKTIDENYQIDIKTRNDEFELRYNTLDHNYQSNLLQIKEKYQQTKEELKNLVFENSKLSQDLTELQDSTTIQIEQLQNTHTATLTQLTKDVEEYKIQNQIELENLKKIVTNLFDDKKKLINALIEAQGNIRVFVRVRPILPHEIEQAKAAGMSTKGNDLTCVNVVNQLDMFNAGQMASEDDSDTHNKLASVTQQHNDVQTLLNNSLGAFKVMVRDDEKNTKNEYEFENVFSQTSTQFDVAQQVLPFVTSVADGYNVCVFAYGQTGSGKSYTMEGTETDMGVNYTALTQLFTVLSDRQQKMLKSGVNHKFSVNISTIEVYNEIVKDLFTNETVTLQMSNGKPTMPDLSNVPVASCNDIRYQLRTRAHPNRTTASTKMNAVSSRSHAILYVNITSTYSVIDQPTQSETVTSRLVLTDLAGSERVHRSGVEGKALTEAANINKSLTVLGRCLASLQSGEKHIPFRDSKLTMALSDCLSGDSKVLMFANVSPAGINASETNSTLQFASRAQRTAVGKAGKNSSTSAMGATAGGGRPTLSALPNGAGAASSASGANAKEKREDEMKIKALENDKSMLQQQLQQLTIQLQNLKQSHQQQVDMMNQDHQSLEQKLDKEKEKTKQAIADKAKTMSTPNPRSSTHMPRSTPSKRISTQHKLSLLPLGEGGNGEKYVPPTPAIANTKEDEYVQLGSIIEPLPEPIIINLNERTTSFVSDASLSAKKRKSTEMIFDENDTNVAIHVNKQPRQNITSSTTPARPTMSRTTTPMAAPSVAPIGSSNRPTLGNKMVQTILPAKMSAPVATKIVPAIGTSVRPTLSASSTTAARPLAPTTTANRPTLNAAGTRGGIATAPPSTAVLKKAVPATTSRPTISAAATVVPPIGTVRKTVVGNSSAAVTAAKRTIGK